MQLNNLCTWDAIDHFLRLIHIPHPIILISAEIQSAHELRYRGVFFEKNRHSCESRNPETLQPVNLDTRSLIGVRDKLRGHDKKNTSTSQLVDPLKGSQLTGAGDFQSETIDHPYFILLSPQNKDMRSYVP